MNRYVRIHLRAVDGRPAGASFLVEGTADVIMSRYFDHMRTLLAEGCDPETAIVWLAEPPEYPTAYVRAGEVAAMVDEPQPETYTP